MICYRLTIITAIIFFSDTHIIRLLQRIQSDSDSFIERNDPTEDLEMIALEKGFSICDNPGSGNCMFFALSQQLQSVKGIQISETVLRRMLVKFLKDFPTLVS